MQDELIAQDASLFAKEWLGTIEERQRLHVKHGGELLVAEL